MLSHLTKLHCINLSQPFSQRSTLLNDKKFCGTPLLHKKIQRNPLERQKSSEQPIIYWRTLF
jgi:hypothetical protein